MSRGSFGTENGYRLKNDDNYIVNNDYETLKEYKAKLSLNNVSLCNGIT